VYLPAEHALDCEGAVFRADGEERVLHHADVGLHPRMLVALDRNQDFRRAKVFSIGGAPFGCV
jgi:hypothetical protein